MGFGVGIEVTRKCNFKCKHCFVSAGKPHQNEMETGEIKELLRDLVACGATAVAWSGGEPLLRQDLEVLTVFARDLQLKPSLVSNGYLASRERLQALKDAGLETIQISLDGPNQAAADRLRKGPREVYDRAVQALKDSVQVGLTTWVCCLLSPQTVGELLEMVELAIKINAKGLRYTMWAPVGRAAGEQYDELAWGSEPVKTFFDHVAQIKASGYPLLIDCPTGPYPGKEQFRCGAGHGSSYITAVGDVYPCTALMFEPYLVGNTREQPVRDILFGERMSKIQRELAASTPAGLCASCRHLERCRGGCPGRTIAAVGSMRGGKNSGALPACLYRLHGVSRSG